MSQKQQQVDVNFFKVPHGFMEHPTIQKLAYSEKWFYICLLKLSNRYSKNEFYHSDTQMQDEFGISPATSKRCRKKLKAIKLIGCKTFCFSETNKKAVQYILHDINWNP